MFVFPLIDLGPKKVNRIGNWFNLMQYIVKHSLKSLKKGSNVTVSKKNKHTPAILQRKHE